MERRAMTDEYDPANPVAPPPLGRCRKCGRQSWAADHIGPVHPCCVRLYDGDEDCVACVTSDTLERQRVKHRDWARRNLGHERPR